MQNNENTQLDTSSEQISEVASTPTTENTITSVETPTSTEAAPTSTEAAPTSTEAAPTSTEAATTSTEAATTSTEAATTSTEAAPTSTEVATAPTEVAMTSTEASTAPTEVATAPTEAAPVPISDSEFGSLVADNSNPSNFEEKLDTDFAIVHPDKVAVPVAPKVTQDKLDDVFDELKAMIETTNTIEVVVNEKVTGGFRVAYKGAPLFLPFSHFSMSRKPNDAEMKDAIGSTLKVSVIEAKENDGRKSIIVSRKGQIAEEFAAKFKVGEKVTGVVSSLPTFGVFINIDGVEGLIHVSRLSHSHVNKPSDLYKVGDTLEAVVIDVNQKEMKLGLSRKELEKSPWEEVEAKFPIDSIHNGTVRRFTDFGAYIELEKGIDGLVRINELSWTKRVKNPNLVLELNKAYDFKVVAINIDKKAISLSYKRVGESPWGEFQAKYPIDAEFSAVISEMNEKGAVVTVAEEIDAFMPRSKMRAFMNGNKMTVAVGDAMQIRVADLSPEDESMIVVPVLTEEQEAEQAMNRQSGGGNNGGGNRSNNRDNRGGDRYEGRGEKVDIPKVGAITFGDMLSNLTLDKLGSGK